MYFESGSLRRNPKGPILVLIGFLAYQSWVELKYAVIGKTAPATVIYAAQTTDCRNSRHPQLIVEYKFLDSTGPVRTEADKQSLDAPRPRAGDTICIEYCPGEPGHSRLSKPLATLVVAGLLVAFALGLICVGIYYTMRTPPPTRGDRLFDGLAR